MIDVIADNNENIVFYDGKCALCNRFVQILLNLDHEKRLKFSSLQGNLAKEVLNHQLMENMDSIVFLKGGNIYTHSMAVIRILKEIGGFWQLMMIFALIPRPLRDGIYQYVAHNRYQWFGSLDYCAILDDKDKERILD